LNVKGELKAQFIDMARLAYSPIRQSPYEQVISVVASELTTDLQAGLTSQVAKERQKHYGLNILNSKPHVSAWMRAVAQFRDPQVYLLLVAATISILVSKIGEGTAISYEALIILAIVALNVVLGFVQEERAERALVSLSKMMPGQTTVIRDGTQKCILVQDVVPGDLLVLREGDSVPADARLSQAISLLTSESSLTGESLPVRKLTEPSEHRAPLADRANMLFAGTVVVSGNARAIVTAVGMETEFGKVAKLLNTEENQVAPLQRRLEHLSKQIGTAVLLIASCVVIALLSIQGVQSASAVIEVLLFGIALAVAATPEGLAAVITLVLAIGVRRMAQKGAIVKKLAAVETLGSTTVIASDKTGTLTCNEMTVRAIVTALGQTDISGSGYDPEGSLSADEGKQLAELQAQEVNQLLLAATLVNNAQLEQTADGWKIRGDPTEAALLTAARKARIQPSVMQSLYPRLAEFPFSSERKMMSTLHRREKSTEEITLFAKGAPDILVDRCTNEFVGGVVRPMSPQRRLEILQCNDLLTSRAFRTLGVATRLLAKMEVAASADVDREAFEQHLTFLGLIGMMDPPRPEVRSSVEQARLGGIRTILITGDHPRTAAAVARDLGIISIGPMLTGPQLDQMSDSELRQVVSITGIYARVNPEHKLRIVHALQKNDEIVAMTGDGVNDAPALKAADIGIAMGVAGTDVAKEAADLILTDDNFSTIVAAVEEGRIIFDNIQKFLRYLLATNLGEVLTLFLSVIILSFQNGGSIHSLVLPLTAAQILWINLVTDGAPALALGVDSASPDIMCRAPRCSTDNIINRQMFSDLLLVAAVMTIGTLLIFFILSGNDSILHRRSLAFNTLIFFQLFNSLSARSYSDSAFRGMFKNRWLCGSILFSIGLQVILLNVSYLRLVFGVVSLSVADWTLCVLVASSVLWVSEITKYFRRRNIPFSDLNPNNAGIAMNESVG
jgi:Ca2+-transporting ATPase